MSGVSLNENEEAQENTSSDKNKKEKIEDINTTNDSSKTDLKTISNWVEKNKNNFGECFYKIFKIKSEIEEIGGCTEIKSILNKKLYRTVFSKFQKEESSKNKSNLNIENTKCDVENIISQECLQNEENSKNSDLCSLESEDSKDKKGRFLIEEVSKKCMLSEPSQLGRFKVLSEMDDVEFRSSNEYNRQTYALFQKQQEQIECLYEMIKETKADDYSQTNSFLSLTSDFNRLVEEFKTFPESDKEDFPSNKLK
ncbi:hypothetical protein EHP00_364 [Ecytonucleospora hepatopenaei]|uniref:Uncharacterized protein n=1 Tax=Ecytonucleospora hepatopenaei TaxID=646526 RepID=A0A1W0E9D2_9MICR|nr:hypothetical protein EHP00_364 [Ecytonucleospora hepatopenaei]